MPAYTHVDGLDITIQFAYLATHRHRIAKRTAKRIAFVKKNLQSAFPS